MREWQDWSDWWRSAQLLPPKDAIQWKLGDYGLCVAAASQGLGATLGWTWLIRDQLDSGALVLSMPTPCARRANFYLMLPADRHQRKIVREFQIG